MNEKIVPDAEGLAPPDKERGEEKGISPHPPFKEKEGQKETPPPPPEGSPLACARARLVAAVAEIRRTAGREAEIAHALDRLSPADRDFVRTVLSGKGWRETGLGKRSFNKRLAAVCRRIGE